MDREETVVKKRKYKVQDREEDRGKGLRAEAYVWLQANRLGFSDSISQADSVEHHGRQTHQEIEVPPPSEAGKACVAFSGEFTTQVTGSPRS